MENPVSDEEVKHKFRTCAKRTSMSDGKIEECINMVDDLENCQDISKLMDILIW